MNAVLDPLQPVATGIAVAPYLVIDIETGYAPEAVIERELARREPPANSKDPTKIEARLRADSALLALRIPLDAVADPGDQFKAVKAVKIEATVDQNVVEVLLGYDAHLFRDDNTDRDARWFSIKKVALDVELAQHECTLAELDLGVVVLTRFEFRPVGRGEAHLTGTIVPILDLSPTTADRLQQAVNRASVPVRIWREPEPGTTDMFHSTAAEVTR